MSRVEGLSRIAGLAVVWVALGFGPGCGRTPDLLPPPRPTPDGSTMATVPVFTQSVNNDVDILFMIDDSGSMREEQANLRRNFPAFTGVLKALPQGLPNVHIGVISSDLGAGPFTTVASCHPGGDHGRFQSAPRAQGGACTAVPRGSFISAIGSAHNFDGDIDPVLSCIAELGTRGCGFEHQLQSIRVALDPALMPPENRGFLRDEAVLAVVLLTDEDDCSAPPDSGLFDPTQDAPDAPLGRLDSFRCNEFGHLCGGQPPPRTAATNLQMCTSAEDGRLVRVSEIADFLKSLKADPNDVMVAAITGPATPYSVEVSNMANQSGVVQAAPEIVPSCMSANGSAAPAVRIRELVDAFGVNGTFLSICADDFRPAMTRIGQEIARRASLECLIQRPADVDPDRPGLQPNCQVVDERQVNGAAVRTTIPACATSAPPCWRVQADAKCPRSATDMIVDRAGVPPDANTRVHVTCETCADASDPRCAILTGP